MKSLLQLRDEFGEFVTHALNEASSPNTVFSLYSRDMLLENNRCVCRAKYINQRTGKIFNINYETTCNGN